MAEDSLLDELVGNGKLYAPELSRAARRWFTQRLLAYVRTRSPADERAEATRLLDVARAQALRCTKALSAFAAGPGAGLTTVVELAPVAAYGAMALYPEVFLGVDQGDLLEFTVVRRCRAVDRMRADVNDLTSGFVYPGDVMERGDVLEQAPNKHGQAFWTGTSIVPGLTGRRYPFVLSTPTGTAAPQDAIERLLKPVTPADLTSEELAQGIDRFRTRVDCSSAAMIVQMASVVEAAADPATLAAALAAEDDRYLAIDHPFGSAAVIGGVVDQGLTPIVLEPTGSGDHVVVKVALPWVFPKQLPWELVLVGPGFEQSVMVDEVEQDSHGDYTGRIVVRHLDRSFEAGSRFIVPGRPEFHLVTDSRPLESLFEQVFVPLPWDQLQVGDHIYLLNHPFHRTYATASPWGGEHAFVCDAPCTLRPALQVSGHGITQTPLWNALDQLLAEANALLDVMRARLARNLASPPSSGTLRWSGPVADLGNFNAATTWPDALRDQAGQPRTANVTVKASVHEFPGILVRVDNRRPREATPPYQSLTFDGTVGTATVDPTSVIFYRLKSELPPQQDWGRSEYLFIERDDKLALPANSPKRVRYRVPYLDDVRGRGGQQMYLFHTGGARFPGARRLSWRDLDEYLNSYLPDGRIFVTRPRVPPPNGVDDYVAALREKGALPASP
jgi:hypothetical protein